MVIRIITQLIFFLILITFFERYGIEIVRRNSLLITHGSQRVKRSPHALAYSKHTVKDMGVCQKIYTLRNTLFEWSETEIIARLASFHRPHGGKTHTHITVKWENWGEPGDWQGFISLVFTLCTAWIPTLSATRDRSWHLFSVVSILSYCTSAVMSFL